VSIRVGPWFETSYGTVKPSEAAALADDTVERFRALGVTLAAGNRLARSRQIAADLAAGRLALTGQSTAGRELAAEALRTIWEFALIVRVIPQDDAPTLRKVQDMVTGALLGRSDLNTIGRNTQFELFVATLFAIGGVKIFGSEPDLRFRMYEQERGLAVKRVRSAKKLRANVSDGARQLAKNGVDGLIVVNVEPFLDGLTTEGGAETAGRRFNERVAPLHNLFPRYQHKPRVLGIIGAGTVPEWEKLDDGRYRFGVAWFMQFRWFTGDPIEQEQTEVFVNAMRTRVEQQLTEFFGA
jgi:hypothetical protein